MLMASAFDCLFGVGAFNFAYLSSCILRRRDPLLLFVIGFVIVISMLVFDGFQYLFMKIQENIKISSLFLQGVQ